MMIVAEAEQSAAAGPVATPVTGPLRLGARIGKTQLPGLPPGSARFAEPFALRARAAGLSALQTSSFGLTTLSVVCMQQDRGIPSRGARYFSRPKRARGSVQECQRDCVLEGAESIQLCGWQCEPSMERD